MNNHDRQSTIEQIQGRNKVQRANPTLNIISILFFVLCFLYILSQVILYAHNTPIIFLLSIGAVTSAIALIRRERLLGLSVVAFILNAGPLFWFWIAS